MPLEKLPNSRRRKRNITSHARNKDNEIGPLCGFKYTYRTKMDGKEESVYKNFGSWII
jgi:hypothetical protein